MRERLTQTARYWLFLAAKLGAGALFSGACLWMVNLFWAPKTPIFHLVPYLFGFDLLYTTVVGVVFLLAYGAGYLAILDQRYRCRVCLRRLRMPIETGSWSRMLQLGRPRMEYICVYGHGKLNVDELQISGREGPEWTEHADLWEELVGTSKGTDAER